MVIMVMAQKNLVLQVDLVAVLLMQVVQVQEAQEVQVMFNPQLQCKDLLVVIHLTQLQEEVAEVAVLLKLVLFQVLQKLVLVVMEFQIVLQVLLSLEQAEVVVEYFVVEQLVLVVQAVAVQVQIQLVLLLRQVQLILVVAVEE